MKLLFDEMLAPSLVNRLADLYPDAEHVRDRGLKQTSDTEVWHQAKKHELGNCTVRQVEDRLRRDSVLIAEFVAHSAEGLLVIRN